MNDILFVVVKAVVTVAAMVVIRYFVPWVKTQIGTAQYKLIENLVRAEVIAAEQTITGDKKGAERKAAVINAVKSWLQKNHINISDEQIETLIESAVYAMNSAKKA